MKEIESSLKFPAPQPGAGAAPDESPAAASEPTVSPHAEGSWISESLEKTGSLIVQAFLKQRRKDFEDFAQREDRKAYAKQRHRYFSDTIAARQEIIEAVRARIERAKAFDPGVTLAKCGADIYNLGKFNDTLSALCREKLLAEHGDAILNVMRGELSIVEQEFTNFQKEYRVELGALASGD